jgi:hypothetical protein
MQEALTSLLNTFGLAWWVEVKTDSPACTYYFGPFGSAQEAEEAQPGYVEDLQQEGAQNITAVVKRCKPTHLTVYEDGSEVRDKDKKVSGSLSEQIP